MTKEYKQLLLKDLSARLPYKVKVCLYEKEMCILMGIDGHQVYLDVDSDSFRIESIKPYLRSITSMTKKEREEFDYIRDIVSAKFINAISKDGFTLAYYDLIDWLNAHHFDYRGLIGAGLALEAPKGVYNIK